MEKSEMERAMDWVTGRDTGTSSKAIMAKMLGGSPPWDSYPSDGADLGRCLRLLAKIPEWNSRIEEMATVGHVWESLVTHWAELKAAYFDDEANATKKKHAFKTYPLMRRLIDAGLDADPLVIVSRRTDAGISSWMRGKGMSVSLGPGVSMKFGS